MPWDLELYLQPLSGAKCALKCSVLTNSLHLHGSLTSPPDSFAVWGGEGPSPCRPAGCAGVARCLVILSPTGPSPSLPTLSSPPPHHDKPDLLSIKEPPATCSFSPNLPSSPLPYPVVPHPICHLRRARSRSSLRGCVVAARGWPGEGFFWQGNGRQLSSRWQHSERHLMGLGTFANLLISFGCNAQNDLETDTETRGGIFGVVTMIPTFHPPWSRLFFILNDKQRGLILFFFLFVKIVSCNSTEPSVVHPLIEPMQANTDYVAAVVCN